MERSGSFLFFASFLLVASCMHPGEKKNNEDVLNVPDELQVTLWAQSPMLYNPTNMDVDVKGRIWVTEAVNYRNFRNNDSFYLHRKEGDRVIILEDTDKDGTADKSIVFVQDTDLVSPVGIAVIGNKIVVSCSPNIIVYTDDNGDDVPDKKEILLTGFGGRDHDHSLHAVYAGPDGKWYFNTGNAGPHVVTDKNGWTLRSGSMYTGGSPYNISNKGNMVSDDGKVWVGGLALRVDPDGRQLEVLAHNFRNSYEVIPDSYGNLWQNDNDDEVLACRTSWIMEGGNAGFFSADGTRSWQADQRPGQNIFTAHWHQDDPGVMPAGDNSGAGAPAGVAMIETDALGEQYMGMLLSADAGRNMIFGYHPRLKGSGYDVGVRTNLFSSVIEDDERYVWNDSTHKKNKEKWFRPSDVTVGTDGAIYIADWYDPVVGGHEMQDSIGYGRIYRVSRRDKKMTAPQIDLNTVEGQIAALKSPAINVRNGGFKRLRDKGDEVIREVMSLLNDANPFVRARAIWLLSQLGPNGQKETEKLLTHKEELVRATAYRALRQALPDISMLATTMAEDTSAFVRREVAISIAGYPYEKKKAILLKLIRSYKGNDRWMLESLGNAIGKNASDIYGAIENIHAHGTPSAKWNTEMADLAWRLHPVEAIGDLSARALDSTLSSEERLRAITALAFINDPRAVKEMSSLANSKLPDVSAASRYWLSHRQTNDWANLANWSRISINTAYERKQAEMKVKMNIMLDERQSDYQRRSRAHQMALDSVGGQMLIGLAAENKLPEKISAFVQQKIFENPDLSVRTQARSYFMSSVPGKDYPVEEVMMLNPEKERGVQVFNSYCASCHKSGNRGNNIGPDLSFVGQKLDDRQLINAIINPDASIAFGYEPWLINLKDNTSVYGFMIADTEQAMTIRDISGKNHVIKKTTIASARKQDKSVMPDAAQMGLTQQDLRNVVEYLNVNSTARRDGN